MTQPIEIVLSFLFYLWWPVIVVVHVVDGVVVFAAAVVFVIVTVDLVVAVVGPRNLILKFGQEWVSNS